MKRIITLATLCGALFFTACGAKDAPPTEPAPTDPAPTEPAVVDEPTEPEAPAAPVFSKEEAAKQLAVVETCEYDFNCPAFEALVALGAEIGEQTAALAMDETKPAKGRAVAMLALAKVKAKVDLATLYESVKKADDYGLRGAFEKLLEALQTDDAALLDKLHAEYLSDADGIDVVPVRGALRVMPGTFGWAVAQLEGEHADRLDVRLVDLVTDTAQAEQLPKVVELLGKLTNPMAKSRLASAAIALGDKGHFQVLLDGLASEDVYDRSDAANQLAEVVKDLPADLKDKAIALLKAGKAGDRGGLTAMGYDKCLKALGATE
ncbi:MAG: hypothetical protein CVU56_25665 [Deltaproteobacteria bacterium HGW-Deltaproteobacteria-14]|jgi:hypothetical protein|nr:MAG: hypothetical protein CVU56_25665 [Deltaproteobacteria bacterium HGW-Deltaproteobacteria-14]